jgi:hypothetical protein
VSALQSSCDPDGGELRLFKCKDSTVSNDKESIMIAT